MRRLVTWDSRTAAWQRLTVDQPPLPLTNTPTTEITWTTAPVVRVRRRTHRPTGSRTAKGGPRLSRVW